MDKSRKNCYLLLKYTLLTCPNTQAPRVWPFKLKKKGSFLLETIRLLNSLEISKRILEKNLKIWSEVRSLETFSFLDRRRLSPEKSISMRAAILNYTTKMGVLHFKHKMWLKDWFSSFPNGSVLKKRLQFTYICRTYVRTFEQEEKIASKDLKYLKLPCPKFKRGRKMANATSGVWSRDSYTFVVTRIQKLT